MKTVIATAIGIMFSLPVIAGDLPNKKEVLIAETAYTQNPWAFKPFVGGELGYGYASGNFGSLGVSTGVEAKYVGIKGSYEFYGNFNKSNGNVLRVVPFVQYPLAYNITPYAGMGVGYAWHNNGQQDPIYTVESGLKYRFAVNTEALAWYEYNHALDRASKPGNAVKIGIRQEF